MMIRVDVKTPRNQAKKCMKTQKMALLGYKEIKKIKEENLISHNRFEWVLEIKDQEEMNNIIMKCARGEVLIKKFYSTLFKLVKRANKVAAKFKKGAAWLKRWMIKTIKKKYEGDSGKLAEYINSMDDKEFQDFLVINDEEEMRALLAGNLIKVEKIEKPLKA
jgi:hypothetical protein